MARLPLQTAYMVFFVSCYTQGPEIEVDENGTLDLSMKKARILDKAAPLTSTNHSVPTASSSPFKTSSLLVNAAFYQALCDHEGWDTPINYSKAHGKTEEEKEVLFQCRSISWRQSVIGERGSLIPPAPFLTILFR